MGTFPDIQKGTQQPVGAEPDVLMAGLNLPAQGINLIFEIKGAQSGESNMNRDSTLLEEIRRLEEPTLLVRTYCWEEPTISLGKHQPEKDKESIYEALKLNQNTPMVTRPTGGRAILHGEDIAFAFITNAPVFLKLSLKDSYCVFTYWLKQTLQQMDYETSNDCTVSNREYLRSALCFETRTPSDILAPDGTKLAGCAQARRAGGILQHGSAFLSPTPMPLEEKFAETLFSIVKGSFHNQ